MKQVTILIGVIAAAAAVVTFKSCRYNWNPHYLSNEAVQVNKTIYNPDSTAAVVNYTLDIGARGFAEYQTVLKTTDLQRDLSKFLLPAEYTSPKWRSNDTLEVVFDEYAGYQLAGPLTNLDLNSDVVAQNGVTIVVVRRKMNKLEMLRKGMRDINAGGQRPI